MVKHVAKDGREIDIDGKTVDAEDFPMVYSAFRKIEERGEAVGHQRDETGTEAVHCWRV